MSRYGRYEGIADLPIRAFTHCGDRRITLEGGDGGGTRYENLEKLYGMQAEQAGRLGRLAEEVADPLLRQVSASAQDYGSLANRERGAAQSAADSSAALGASQAQLIDQMTSYGINPSDARYQKTFANMSLAGAAGDAAGRTAARNKVSDMGFARLLDASGAASGTFPNASVALANAGNTATNVANMGMQQQQANNQAVGDAVRGGINIASLFKAADGGQVPYFENGGYVQHFARGGSVLQMPTPPPPPSGGPVGPSMGSQIAGAAGPVIAKGAGPLGQGITAAGQATGSPGMVAFGNGMSAGKTLDPSVMQMFTSPETVAYQMAQQQVTPALAGIETGASAGAAAAGAGEAAGVAGAALGEAAVGTAAVEAGAGLAGAGAAGAGLAAAMPWVGAALLAGSALGLFKDGGAVGQSGRSVTPGSDGARGGKVNGPGGPKDDRVPALLSAGEFVLPVGTVKMLGLAKLEKMRKAGLEFERKLGIGRA